MFKNGYRPIGRGPTYQRLKNAPNNKKPHQNSRQQKGDTKPVCKVNRR
jgi:hypothetical protein